MDKQLAVFCCENSSIKALDTVADTKMLDLIDIVRMPCSGKVETGIILKCLEKGYAGVLVIGCPKDNCKFLRGSTRADLRVSRVQERLKAIGIDPGCVRMEFLSSLDGHKFTAAVEEMLHLIKAG